MVSKFQKIVDILRGKDSSIRFKKFEKYCQKNDIVRKTDKIFQKSDVPIEIIIPCIDKDCGVLPYVIDSARKNILHPIEHINVISPKNSEKIREICEVKGCNFIDEASILPKEKAKNSGWIYQQFLKMAYCDFAKTDYYLVLDSDTIINQPVAFIENGKQLLEFSDEYHTPYFRMLKRLGIFENTHVSFIAHHMLFNKEIMKDFLKYVEKTFQKAWHELLMDYNSSESTLSEYEIYSNFILKNHISKVIVDYYYNKGFELQNRENIPDVIEKNSEYRTLSFHDYSYAQRGK